MSRSLHTLPNRHDLEQIHRRMANGVVIDVLRASTTAAVALMNGARAIYPCAEIEEARQLRNELNRQGQSALLCGERDGYVIDGFDLGNSPLEYTPPRIGGRVLILATTNGTRALKATRQILSGLVCLGGMINAQAVARKLIKSEDDILLVCSGKEEFFALEDFVGAGMIIDEVLQLDPSEKWILDDASKAALVLYNFHRSDLLEMLRNSAHGKYLSECGFTNDLPICAQTNTCESVPTYRDTVLISS